MTGITAAMLLAVKASAESQVALGESADVQFGAVYFPRDVRSADTIRIPAPGQEASATCVPSPGNGDQLVIELAGDDWVPRDGAPATLDHRASFASYVRRTGDEGREQLWRLRCTAPLPAGATVASVAAAKISTGVDEVLVGDELATATPPVARCVDADRTVVACGDAAAVGATIDVTQYGGAVFVLSGTRRVG